MIYKIFNKFDNLKWKVLLLILFSILLKWVYFSIIYHFYANNYPHLYNISNGDNKVYMEFCENYYVTGNYFIGFGHFVDYTFRMPGFNFIYYPFRLLLSKESTMDAIIILQTILSGIAAYCIAKISYYFFRSKKSFYFVYILTCFGFLISFYNNMLMTESLAFSSMVFSIYFLLKGIESKKSIYFLIAGGFSTWMIFLRPFMLVLFILLVTVLFLDRKKIVLKNTFYFVLFFVLFDGIWIVRNYSKTNSFIPLQTSASWADRSKPLLAKLEFIKTFGFHWEPWIHYSQSGWLDDGDKKIDLSYVHQIFPNRTFNGDLTVDSLIKVRKFFFNSTNTKLSLSDQKYNANNAVRLFSKFNLELKHERPLDYYFLNRIRILKSFLSENTFHSFVLLKYPFNVIGIFSETFYNLFLKSIGFIGLILMLIKYRKNYLLVSVLTFIPIFIVLFFPIYGGVDETRFFYLATPFLMISSGYFLHVFLKWKIKNLLILGACLSVPFYLTVVKMISIINF